MDKVGVEGEVRVGGLAPGVGRWSVEDHLQDGIRGDLLEEVGEVPKCVSTFWNVQLAERLCFCRKQSNCVN